MSGTNYLRFFANLPTRYFRCHAGEPNFIFLRFGDAERRFELAEARLRFPDFLRRGEERPEPRGKSAARLAGVI